MRLAELAGAIGPMHGWAMATAAVVSAAAALVGTLLVVRRMSLLGDAISHAVLPGVVLAVLVKVTISRIGRTSLARGA